MLEKCYWLFCFVPIEKQADTQIFGFAEYLAALALLVLLFMIVDVRYKFRLAITPGFLFVASFGLTVIIGLQTLLTDLWVAERWWVPRVAYLNLAGWQAISGAMFLGTFLTWVWYAFIKPPVFSRRNARRYHLELYRVIVKGSNDELPAIAYEFGRSVRSIVKLCRVRSIDDKDKRMRTGDYAYQILFMIANPKFCRHIVESANTVAIEIFESVNELVRFDLPIGEFAKAVSSAAIENKDSILYHEGDQFSRDLIGRWKPWGQSVYGHYKLVESLAANGGSPLDMASVSHKRWDADNFEAYYNAVRITFRAYIDSDLRDTHSYALHQAIGSFEWGFFNLRDLSSNASPWESLDYRRLSLCVQFICDALRIIEKSNVKPKQRRAPHGGKHDFDDVYELLASSAFHLIQAAAHVTGSIDLVWSVQYGAVWVNLSRPTAAEEAGKIFGIRLRRLLFDEIKSVESLPHFQNMPLLGMLLNIFGLRHSKKVERPDDHGFRGLARIAQRIAVRNFCRIADDNPRLSESMLVGGISYDPKSGSLVKTYSSGLEREPSREYLKVQTDEPK